MWIWRSLSKINKIQENRHASRKNIFENICENNRPIEKTFNKICSQNNCSCHWKGSIYKKLVSLSDNDLPVWNYFCCILSTSKVQCLGMRHVFAKGICNVFENKNYIFGKSDILIKVLLQNITQNAYFS